METKWEYDLPTNEHSHDFDYESPIFIKNNTIYFICKSEQRLQLHMIDVDSGTGKIENIPLGKQRISTSFFILEYKEKIIFYTGDFYVYDQSEILRITNLKRVEGTRGEVNSYLLHDCKLLFTTRDYLFCYDLDTLSLEWKVNISNANYITGEITLFENTVACYGDHELLLIEMESGKVSDRIKISRINKLFHPIRIDDENILIGYTNWTNAGVLKYNQKLKQVIWRNKRKFQGPQLKCKVYQQKEKIIWVKNSTELICLDIENGEEIYSVRTNPWLYTDLHFWGDNLLFGTSGRDGYINCIDVKSGKVNWSVFLKNGCAYFDIDRTTVLVGDFNKSIKQIEIKNGKILQDYQVDGEVVGDIKVYKDSVYTVIWGNADKPIRLIKVKI
ncbi:MAG: hypothetical protein K2K70_14485 [Lachnospiraceae bacterium]|nr:hypothetical protein [Lachnospiraceae bacterium]